MDSLSAFRRRQLASVTTPESIEAVWLVPVPALKVSARSGVFQPGRERRVGPCEPPRPPSVDQDPIVPGSRSERIEDAGHLDGWGSPASSGDKTVNLVSGSQSLYRRRDVQAEAGQLFEVEGREGLQALGAVRGELQTHDPTVVVPSRPLDEASGLSPIHQPDHTVVLEEEVVGHLTNGGPGRDAVTSDG